MIAQNVRKGLGSTVAVLGNDTPRDSPSPSPVLLLRGGSLAWGLWDSRRVGFTSPKASPLSVRQWEANGMVMLNKKSENSSEKQIFKIWNCEYVRDSQKISSLISKTATESLCRDMHIKCNTSQLSSSVSCTRPVLTPRSSWQSPVSLQLWRLSPPWM